MSTTATTLLLTLTLVALLALDLKLARGYFRIFRKRDKITDPFARWWLKKNLLKLALASGAYLIGLILIYAPDVTLELPSFSGNSAGSGVVGGLLLTLLLAALLGLDMKLAHRYFKSHRKSTSAGEPYWRWWVKRNPLKLALAGGAYLMGLALIYLPDFTLQIPAVDAMAAKPGVLGFLSLGLILVAVLGLDLKLAHRYFQTYQKRDKIADPFWRWWLRTNRLKLALVGGLFLLVLALIFVPELPLINSIAAKPGTAGVFVLTLILVLLLLLDLKLTHGYFQDNRQRDKIRDPFWLWWFKRSPFKLVLISGAYLFGLSLALFPDFTLDIPLLNLILNPRFLMYLFFSDPRILAGLILTVGMSIYLAIDLFGARTVFRDIWGSRRSFLGVARWWIGQNRSKLAIMGGVYLVGLLVAFIILPLGIYYFRSGPTRYLTNANNYFQAKKYQEAALELRNAIREEPGNAASHLALAQTLWRLNSLKEALEAGRTAAQLDPKLYQAHLLQGTLALATGDYDQALSAAQAAQRLQPESPEPGALLARIYTAQKRYDQAAVPLREQLKKNPENLETRILLVNNGLARRAFAEANQLAEAGLKAGANSSLLLLRASALQGLGRGADAVTAFKSAALLDPKSPRPYQAMADLATQRGDYTGAIANYEEVLKRDPNNLSAMNNLASLLSDHDFDLNRAAALAGQLYQRTPRDPVVMDTLGWVLSRQGKNNEALPLLRRAATMTSTVAEVQYHLGAALLAAGQRDEGRVVLARALKLEPNSPIAAKVRALLNNVQK
jgi:tetratricopeptide (TPR) repeat protein